MSSISALFTTMIIACATLASAGEVTEVRLGTQFGLGYLPLTVVQARGFIEKQALAAGLGEVKTTWVTLSGGAATNDALLSGSVDLVSNGVAPLVVIWAKTKGAVRGLSALGNAPIQLNSTNPAVKTIRDLGDGDRIAVPAVKVSIQAVLLQIAAAKEFGDADYARLDRLTVSMKHPDAVAALLSGKTEITGHFATPPFSDQELKNPRVHTILDSYDLLGGPHTQNVVVGRKAFIDANPKTTAAILAAIEEAIVLINTEPKTVAEIYLKATGSKESLEAVLAQIADPRLAFTTTPLKTTVIADFLHHTGTTAVKPADWKELFFPLIHHKHGGS